MAKVPMVVDSLEDVDEEYRGLYGEHEDGGFVLDAGGVDKHPTVVGLKKHQQRLLDEAKSAKRDKQEIEERFDGIDPDRAREALAKYEEWEAKGELPDADAIPRELHEKRIEAAKNQATEAVDKATERADRLQAALERREVLGTLRKAVADAGFKDEYRDDVVRRLLEDEPEVVWNDDDPRGVFTNEFGEKVEITDYVEAWAKSDEADKYMPPSGNKGSGASNSGEGVRGGKNPFTPEYWNMTEQGRLVENKPEQARQLILAAGKNPAKYGL